MNKKRAADTVEIAYIQGIGERLIENFI